MKSYAKQLFSFKNNLLAQVGLDIGGSLTKIALVLNKEAKSDNLLFLKENNFENGKIIFKQNKKLN